MLSLKSLTGFLKKVSSTGRDDNAKDGKSKSSADGAAAGTATGAAAAAAAAGGPSSSGNYPHSNTTTGSSPNDVASSAKGTPATRSSTAAFPIAQGGKKGDDVSFIESPLFGMTSAFGDASMFASSSILKGLAPNTSTQDILRHIQRVVQERSDELQGIEEELEKEEEEEEAAAAAAAAASAAGRSPRVSQSHLPTAAPSPGEAAGINARAATPHAVSEATTTAATTTGGASVPGQPPSSSSSPPNTTSKTLREALRKIHRMRGEMIDALDVCLQEVPEAVLHSQTTPSAAAAAEEENKVPLSSMTRTNSVVLPTSLTTAPSALADATAAAGDASAEWEPANASMEGVRPETGITTPRNPSIIATPVEAAELSLVAVAFPDPSQPPLSPAPATYTHYEWRGLLLQVVNVLVRIDRILIHDVRRRAMEKLAPGWQAAQQLSAAGQQLPQHPSHYHSYTNNNNNNSSISGADFRWQRFSQVFTTASEKPPPSPGAASKANSAALTPTRHAQQQQQQQQRGDSTSGAAASSTVLNSPHLAMLRSDARPRTPDDGESLSSVVPASLLLLASGQPTPKDSPLPPNVGGSTTTTTTNATATIMSGGNGGGVAAAAATTASAASQHSANVPSPLSKVKHALVESGVLTPEARVDRALSKDDKKALEELLTIGCSLATWAIIKAILRHHLQVLASRQRSLQSTRNGVSGGNTLTQSATATVNYAGGGGGGGNATANSLERAVLDMSLSATTMDLASTITATGSGRPPLAPLPPPAPAGLGGNTAATTGSSSSVTGAAHDESAAATEDLVAAMRGAGTKKVVFPNIQLHNVTESDAAASDDIPYIDWESVVQELAEWLEYPAHRIIAECTLCASFLRDDGREMVMCMLQKPKPRQLLSSIHRHAEKLRHTDPTAAGAASQATAPPTASSSPSAPASSPRGAAAGNAAATAAPSTASGAGSSGAAAASGSANTATAASGSVSSSSGATPPGGSAAANAKSIPVSPTPVQGSAEDPTLVMDDLVAQLEQVYRKAVGDTWSAFLEKAIESEVTSVQMTAYGATADGAADASPAFPESEDGIAPKQQSGLSIPSAATSAPASPLTKAYITDTTTLSRLATAYFFGSDAWSERKRERRFSVLYRSMRSRLERYSESAATRRSMRRGTSLAASPVQTNQNTAVASPVELQPSAELTLSPAASPPQTARTSLVAAMTTAAAPAAAAAAAGATPSTTTATTAAAGGGGAPAQALVGSAGVSPFQSSTSPPATLPPAASLTPTKFSVEDTSSRGPPQQLQQLHSGATGGPSSLGARHGLLGSQLVAHQLASSNASNAAGSTHSTPLAASLQMSRDGGYSDVEAASALSVAGTMHGSSLTAHLHPHYTMPMPEQSATWTPFGFMMTPTETMTPPPEPHPPLHASTVSATAATSAATSASVGAAASPVGGSGGQHPAAMGVTPLRSNGDDDGANTITTTNNPSFMGASGGAAGPPPSNAAAASSHVYGGPLEHPLARLVLERIVNMAWSAALHKRGEQCLTAKPPRLQEGELNAQEERLVAGAFGEFRARQRSLVSLINARLASGKSVEALMNAQKHFRFEKKDWTSHNQTIFSALRYLQSMVLLVRAQAACRVYGAVIETVQFVLPQATLCEQMLQVLAPRPRRDCILRFAECRAKLLRSYVYLLKECWLAHAAFNDHPKAAKYFTQCVQVLQMLRRRSRESELFAAYMERGSQLMKMKDYKKSVELFRLAVNIAKKSLQDADAAATAAAAATASAAQGSSSAAAAAPPSLGSTMTNMASAVAAATASMTIKANGPSSSSAGGGGATAAAPQQNFHRNMHFRGAGSGLLYTAEEHSVGTSAATADDLEFAWRVAESERMLALSFVTQAEHEVNVRERREELSNAVSNAYSSQRSLQRWQVKGGTPKRLLTAVPCSLIVICKGLLLLNQARKAALLLEPLIENKPSSALVRPPMWREILDPTEDPYTAEDVVLRTYVCSVKIAVYMLYARCLAEFDGERALRAVTQVDQLLQESDAWIYNIRTQLRRALEEVRGKDKSGTAPTSPFTARNPEMPSGVTAGPAAANASTAGAAVGAAHTAAAEETEEGQSAARWGRGGADAAAVSGATSTTATVCGSPGLPSATTTEVPPLRISHVGQHTLTTSSTSAAGQWGDSAARMPSSCGSYQSPELNTPEEAPLRSRRANAAGGGGSSSAAPSRDDVTIHDEDDRSRPSAHMPTSGSSGNAEPWNCGNNTSVGGAAAPATTHHSSNISHPPMHLVHSSGAVVATAAGGGAQQQQPLPSQPVLRIQMESASECMTALFALREGKSHIRKALRDIFIVSGDAHALIKNWEEALKSYSHALVISMSEVEAANAATQPRHRTSQFATPRNTAVSPRSSVVGVATNNAVAAAAAGHDELTSQPSSYGHAATTTGGGGGVANASHQATAGGSSHRGYGGAASTATTQATTTAATPGGHNNNNNNSSAQCWGQVVPLDEEFFLWDEEDVLIADNLVNRELTASTAAKDLRAVVADEERMDSRACESLVLSKLANVYRALDKPTTAIHYHNLVMDYANECQDKLLAYNSLLSLARLYTAAASTEAAREAWAKVSDLAKDYEDKEVSRETMRNIVAGQETAGMYLEVVKTAEELEKLATGEEGEDAAADRRFALEALANANLQLGQYDACITALDNREKVQEKSAEWNGRLLSMRAKARMGLNKPAEAIKVMQSWASKARNLGNWVELGKANSALSAAYASENQNMQARHYHEATLNAFALAETLNEDCQHIALDSARWLVHYAYLDDATVQIDPALTYTGGCLSSDSDASGNNGGGDFRYTDSGLCNSSGDLGEMLAKEEAMRRSSSSLIADSLRMRGRGLHDDEDDDRDGQFDEEDGEDDFLGRTGRSVSNHSLFGMRPPMLSESDGPSSAPDAAADNNDEDIGGDEKASAAATPSSSSFSPEAASLDRGKDSSAPRSREASEDSADRSFRDNLSGSLLPKDPACATQPPSLGASFSHASSAATPTDDAAAHVENPELNYSGSSAGQSSMGDSDALMEEAEDESRRRREGDEALLTVDDDTPAATTAEPTRRPEGADAAVAAAVAAAAQNSIFFSFGDDDDDTPDFTVSSKHSSSSSSSSSSSLSAAAPPTPTVTTAAVKSSANAAAGASKSATSNYVPPPTALANVSICSRPAAAAAGTDVLEISVGGGGAGSGSGGRRGASEAGSGSGKTGSPLSGGAGRGAGFGDARDGSAPGSSANATYASGGGGTAAAGGGGGLQDGEEGRLERKPATVRTTYFRGAVEQMEAAAQLLLVPRSVSRLVVPYSPAEAVDLALLTHPQSLFVFYFAEYTTEYGAQCDVVVRPPGTAGFMKLRTQISLREYHSKDVVNSLLTNLSAEMSVAGDREAADMGASVSHPFGGAMARVGAAGSSSNSSPTLANVRPDALRAALDEETRACLRNLHADAWQPIIDRMRRERVAYEDAETVVIMPDISLLHLPFAGLLPSPDYGGEEAPLGEQFTLLVTPSLTHFVYHGMSEQRPLSSADACGALDPSMPRYIFLPYDAAGGAPNSGGGGGGAALTSVPSSPRLKQQATAPATKAAVAAPAPSTAGKPPTSSAAPAAPSSSWPPVTPTASAGDSVLAAPTFAATAGGTATRRESMVHDVPPAAAAATDDGTFASLLRTWKVHRGCTRKELIQAFTDYRTRALMFLGPIDGAGVRVADGVVTLQDLMQSLQQARSQQATQTANAAAAAAAQNSANNASVSAATLPAMTGTLPPIPLPPLCTHMDLLILTADRGVYPSVTCAGTTASLCMSLGVHRVLRLNTVHGLTPNDEQREFIAQYLANLRKAMRWALKNPYAVALRTTIAEARAKGMSSNTWGAFTLVGAA